MLPPFSRLTHYQDTVQRIPMRDGALLAVRMVGTGAPVLLLHGFGMQSALWLPNVLPLAGRYRFILPDLRGFGHSHRIRPNQPDTLANNCEDVIDILDHLGLDQVALGGISMGAMTGLKMNQLGLFHRVSRYLHIDQSPQVLNGAGWSYGLFGAEQDAMFARFYRLLSQFEAVGVDTPYTQLPQPLRRSFMADLGEFVGFAMRSPKQRPLWRTLFAHGERLIAGRLLPVEHLQTYLAIINSYLHGDHDSRPTLSQIQIPMTIMVGMQSQMYPAAGQLAIKDYVPHARIVAFDRAGHAPMLDQPLKFQRELSRFLSA